MTRHASFSTRFWTRLLAVLLLFALAGCASMSVRHMPRNAWGVNKSGHIDLNFWSFDYATETREEGYSVRGTARPVPDTAPEWATWIDELWLAVYLCDASGKVLAEDVKVVVPRPFDQSGIPFAFAFEPKSLAGGPLSITFGYRMTLTERPPVAPPAAGEAPGQGQGRVFFGSESAISVP